MLNLQDFLHFEINSVQLNENDFNIESIVSVFINDNESKIKTEFYDLLRFRIIQIDNKNNHKILYKSLKNSSSLRYLKNDLNINKLMQYKDKDISFQYYDISFLDIINREFFIDIESDGIKQKKHVLNFDFTLNKSVENLVYYISIYIDKNKVKNKLNISNNINDHVFTSFDTFINDKKSVNTRLVDYRQLNKINLDDLLFNKSKISSFQEQMVKKELNNENFILMSNKSKNSYGYNLLFLIDLYEIYKNQSRFNYLLDNPKFSNIVFNFIENIQNIKYSINRISINEQIKSFDSEDINVENDFYLNNKNVNLISFYDLNDDNSKQYEYKLSINFKDVLVSFLEDLIEKINLRINDLHFLNSISTKNGYHNIESDTFSSLFYQEAYNKDNEIFFNIMDLLIYISDYFINSDVDKISILSLMDEKSFSTKTLNFLISVYENLYRQIFNEISLNETFNELNYEFSKVIELQKDEIYYNILNDDKSKILKKINFTDLSSLSTKNILKFFPAGVVNNLNTYAYNNINSISFKERKFVLNNCISKTNTENLNKFIIDILYYLNNTLETPQLFDQIFDLLFDKELIFQKYDDVDSLQNVSYSLSNDKKTPLKEEIDIKSKIDLLFNVFIDDLLIEHQRLFDIYLINKNKLSINTPYQVSALYNSYINSDLVFDNFQTISFLEKFIFLFLYKIFYQIEYFDFIDLKWKLLENSIIQQVKNRNLLCRFNQYFSTEYNIPFINELSFELNNKFFIFQNEGEQSRKEELKENYLGLLLANKNVVDIKNNINLPAKIATKVREQETQKKEERLQQIKDSMKSPATMKTITQLENKEINSRIKGLEDKIKNTASEDKIRIESFNKLITANKEVLKKINKLGM